MFEKQIFLNGTLRRDRKHISLPLKQKLDVGEYKYFGYKEILLVMYKKKKQKIQKILLLSTPAIAENEIIKIQRRDRQKEDEKTLILIYNYNKFMRDVSVSNMILYIYLDERTLTFWKKVVLSIFSRLVLNSYILHKKNTHDKIIARLVFINKIFISIVKEWMAEKKIERAKLLDATSRTATVLDMKELLERKEETYVVYSRKNGRSMRKSHTICNLWNKGLYDLMCNYKC